VDFEGIEDSTITIRDRDTTKQVRVPMDNIRETIRTLVEGASLEKVGKIIK
jgi:glycyl-tRNA synthetase